MSNYKLQKKILITGKIRLLTGLHIGAANSQMDIGGVDSAVLRNPITNKPYIPGSSLKGKLRSLIEVKDGTISEKQVGDVKHTVTDNPEHRAAKLFGTAISNKEEAHKQRPSKLIVRDGEILNEEYESDLPYTEVKTEVTIDRITAKAMPRTLERVPAGVEFSLNLVLNVFNEDNENELLDTLVEAMELLENDYLGGSGSRGYGQIKFIVEEAKDVFSGNDYSDKFKKFKDNE